ncbi:MAG: cell division protein ZapD [Cardiobacteriaceae bacterium]|nr:cell division protein ZapD [Cardiobacteriaceae bacterium]
MSHAPSSLPSLPPLTVYEQPLNERMRLFMRLESMFTQMKNFHRADEYYSIQLFLNALFDVLDFLHRYEIRSEIIKELQRYRSAIERGNPAFAQPAQSPGELLADIDHSLQEAHAINFNIISSLRENELFNSMRQRNFNQSGNCLFEVPAYQHWLVRQGNRENPFLIQCYDMFQPIIRAIILILRLVRQSDEMRSVRAEKGMYLKALNSQMRNQMIRIHMGSDDTVFPRISGDKHRFAVRFHHQGNPEYRAEQSRDDITFGVQICAL